MSEISMIELYYGAECSNNKEKNIRKVDELLKWFEPIPVTESIREICRQKAQLRKTGQLIEDFDLMIGCTAKTENMVLVTENVSHLSRIEGVKIENWVER